MKICEKLDFTCYAGFNDVQSKAVHPWVPIALVKKKCPRFNQHDLINLTPIDIFMYLYMIHYIKTQFRMNLQLNKNGALWFIKRERIKETRGKVRKIVLKNLKNTKKKYHFKMFSVI